MAADIDYASRMSDADALIWQLERDPQLRSTVMSIVLLDRAPERERMRAVAERLTRMVPRFRQRVAVDPLGVATPRWVLDDAFNMDYHLRWVVAPAPADLDTVLALAEPIGMQAFDPARPLWEWTVVEGLPGGRAAFIYKTHHAMSDGMGGQAMAMALYDFERDAAPAAELPLPSADDVTSGSLVDALAHEGAAVAGAAVTVARALLRGARSLAFSPRSSIRTVRDFAGSAQRMTSLETVAKSDVLVGRSLSSRYACIPLSLPAMKAAARAADVKVNDIFLAGIAEGMRRYHDEHASTVDELRMSMMVNVRTADSGPAGNHFAAVLVPLDIAESGPVERAQSLRAQLGGIRDEPALGLSRLTMNMFRRLPDPLTVRLMGGIQRSVDVISSNIPGSPIPVFLAGAQLERLIPLGPLTGAAVNLTMMSHLDEVTVGINMDAAAVRDIEVFLDCTRAGFEQVCGTAV